MSGRPVRLCKTHPQLCRTRANLQLKVSGLEVLPLAPLQRRERRRCSLSLRSPGPAGAAATLGHQPVASAGPQQTGRQVTPRFILLEPFFLLLPSNGSLAFVLEPYFSLCCQACSARRRKAFPFKHKVPGQPCSLCFFHTGRVVFPASVALEKPRAPGLCRMLELQGSA